MAAQLKLVQVGAIAEMLGVQRQRADELTRRKGFPEPDVRIAETRLWREDIIRQWQRMQDKGQAPPECPTCGQAAWPRTTGEIELREVASDAPGVVGSRATSTAKQRKRAAAR